MSYRPPAEFGPFIKHFLESKHASKRSLEKVTGITRKTLDRWMSEDAEWIQYGTIEKFAEYFHLTLDVFFEEFEAYKQNMASDTAQAPPHLVGNNETATPLPGDFAPPPAPNKRRLTQRVVAGIAIVSLLILATYVFISNPWTEHTNKPVMIAGNVVCANNETVVGVWINTFKGSTVDKSISGYADSHNLNKGGSAVGFVYMLRGDAYDVHVGCGGTKLNWKGKYYTEMGSGPVHDLNVHSFRGHDVPPAIDYGACELTK